MASYIPIGIVIASICYSHIKILLLSTTKIRSEFFNCTIFIIDLISLPLCFYTNGFFLLQIIHVNLTQENPKPLEVGKKLDMTYSVKWSETNITFGHRFDVYLDYHFFEHQVTSFFLFLHLNLITNLPSLLEICYCFTKSSKCLSYHADSLVLYFQFIYDGYLPYWTGFNDFDAYS